MDHMVMRRTAGAVAGAVVVVLALCGRAEAQFGGLQRLIFRGSEFLNDRDFISSPQGGPLFENNIFRQRLEHNRTGGGYTFEEFRFFGPDSFDNPNTLDLGPLKIQLGRDPTVVTSPQPVGIHNRIGYTTRFLPEVFFESQTGQRNFDIFSGQTSFIATPINYTVSLNTGLEDFTWTGNALINSNGRVNALGFYDFDLRLTNVGSYTAEGVFLEDEQVTDLDTGQINVSGNLFMDAVASIFQSTLQPINALPPRIFSGASQKDKKADELLARLQAGEKLGDSDMQYLVTQMFLTAFRNDPLGVIENGLPSSVPGFEALTLSTAPPEGASPDPAAIVASDALSGGGTAAGGTSSGSVFNVPEPGTLLLLASAAGVVGAARSLSRRRR
jgi:hypothetical protein